MLASDKNYEQWHIQLDDFEEHFVGFWANNQPNQPARSIYWSIRLYTPSRAGVELSMIHWIQDRLFFTSCDWLIRSWFCWTSFYRFETLFFSFFLFRRCELPILLGLSTNINIRSNTNLLEDLRAREEEGARWSWEKILYLILWCRNMKIIIRISFWHI